MEHAEAGRRWQQIRTLAPLPSGKNEMDNGASPHIRMLRLAEVQARLGVARSTLYAYLNKRSPSYLPAFPKPVRLSSTVAFIEHEIESFVVGLMQAREGAPDER